MTVVRESRATRDGLFGFLTLAFAVALVRGLIGASTTTGRIAVAVIIGGVLVALVVVWIVAIRNPHVLEVTDDEIRYVTPSGKGDWKMGKAKGDEVQFVARQAGRVAMLYLYQPASGVREPLRLFTRKPVRAGVEAHGWRFGR
jgi:hypothetical protein